MFHSSKACETFLYYPQAWNNSYYCRI